MTALPKPEKRGRKPPKRIPRRTMRVPLRRVLSAQQQAFVDAGKRYAKTKKLCDDTFALIVRIRGQNRCKLCGRAGDTDCAHLISRRYEGPRISFDNAWCLCSACHMRWTQDPLGWRRLMCSYFGEVEWARREALAEIPTRTDYTLARFALHLLLRAEEADAYRYGLDVSFGRLLERHAALEG